MEEIVGYNSYTLMLKKHRMTCKLEKNNLNLKGSNQKQNHINVHVRESPQLNNLNC